MTGAFLGLGSNLGDRLENLRRAVEMLRDRGAEVARSSRVYETDPVGGPPGQPDYLNAVVSVDWAGSARELLGACLGVEESMGRVRDEPRGPRIIDVDILTFGEERIDEPDLTVPHPRMHERGFVLVPLLELEPDPPLPGDRKISGLRMGVELLEGVRLHSAALA